jgi:hypothetical protein
MLVPFNMPYHLANNNNKDKNEGDIYPVNVSVEYCFISLPGVKRIYYWREITLHD